VHYQARPDRCDHDTPEDGRDLGELHDFMRGSVVAPDGFDFTAPALDEPLSADQGHIHE
jgi:hypothetical protein